MRAHETGATGHQNPLSRQAHVGTLMSAPPYGAPVMMGTQFLLDCECDARPETHFAHTGTPARASMTETFRVS
jgi:hypothetical protein